MAQDMTISDCVRVVPAGRAYGVRLEIEQQSFWIGTPLVELTREEADFLRSMLMIALKKLCEPPARTSLRDCCRRYAMGEPFCADCPATIDNQQAPLLGDAPDADAEIIARIIGEHVRPHYEVDKIGTRDAARAIIELIRQNRGLA